MADLEKNLEAFLENPDISHEIVKALKEFITTQPRQILEVEHGGYEEIEERQYIARRFMKALENMNIALERVMTSVLWSLVMTCPIQQLREVNSEYPPNAQASVLEFASKRTGTLLKICKINQPANLLPRKDSVLSLPTFNSVHLTRAPNSPGKRAHGD